MIKQLFIITLIFSGLFIILPAIIIFVFSKKSKDKENFMKALYLTTVINILLMILLVSLWITPVKEKGNNNSNTTKTTSKKESNIEISLSDAGFNEINISEYKKLVESEEKSIILVARPTCGYCEKFTPILKQAQVELDLIVNYLNTDELNQKDMEEFESSFDFGDWGTPMVLIVQNSKLIDKNIGYTDLETIKQFFINNELGK